MKTSYRNELAAAAVAMLCCYATACGGVKGHTYSGNMVTVSFQSGGKASANMGPATSDCTYTQKSDKVELNCDGVPLELTVGSDGSLNGPPDGMMGKLTKVK